MPPAPRAPHSDDEPPACGARGDRHAVPPAARHRFAANGLVYASAWPAPGMRAAPAATPPGAPPDVIVIPGEIPPAPLAAAPQAGDCRLPGPGRIVIEDAAFRVLVEEGARVTLDLGPAVGSGQISLLIGYAATSVLLHQRGGLPLHAAAAVGPGGGAALFLGGAGAGKSTLAAALAGRGWVLAGDDLIALEDAPAPAIHPAISAVKLWPDSAGALGAGAMGAAIAVEGLSKDVVALAPDAARDPRWPAPLNAIFALDWLHPSDAAPELDRLSPLDALPHLLGAVHRPALMRALGREAEIMSRLAAVAAAVPCHRLKRPRSYAGMAATLALIAQAAAPLAPDDTRPA